jgi:hypothetical protein
MTHKPHARDWAEYPALAIGDPVEARRTYVQAFAATIRANPDIPAYAALIVAGFRPEDIERYWRIV